MSKSAGIFQNGARLDGNFLPRIPLKILGIKPSLNLSTEIESFDLKNHVQLRLHTESSSRLRAYERKRYLLADRLICKYLPRNRVCMIKNNCFTNLYLLLRFRSQFRLYICIHVMFHHSTVLLRSFTEGLAVALWAAWAWPTLVIIK
jgi:hypothetical protein